jgi:hypothetical protein
MTIATEHAALERITADCRRLLAKALEGVKQPSDDDPVTDNFFEAERNIFARPTFTAEDDDAQVIDCLEENLRDLRSRGANLSGVLFIGAQALNGQIEMCLLAPGQKPPPVRQDPRRNSGSTDGYRRVPGANG